MELQVGVKAFLKNKKGRYLLLLRSAKYGKNGGVWDIPGGRINVGTNLFSNLRREVLEETQLVLHETPVLIAAQDIMVEYAGKHVVRLTYKGVIDGDPVLDEENDAYKWLTLEEILKIEPLDKYVKEVIDSGSVK